MRFLADENFPGDAVRRLEAAGHDVIWIRSVSPGLSDTEIVAWAAQEGRIVLTFDKDFGEIARRSALPASCGVVLIRLPMPAASDAGAELAARIGERSDWAGHFSVVEPGRTRMRPIDNK